MLYKIGVLFCHCWKPVNRRFRFVLKTRAPLAVIAVWRMSEELLQPFNAALKSGKLS
jgi:hypothetical protein